MMDFDHFGGPLTGKPLSQADKAAAVLLAMGKGVAGKLLKYFTQAELQTIIASVHGGRQGHMPTWDERMTDAEIRNLSLYVHDLGTGQP